MRTFRFRTCIARSPVVCHRVINPDSCTPSPAAVWFQVVAADSAEPGELRLGFGAVRRVNVARGEDNTNADPVILSVLVYQLAAKDVLVGLISFSENA